MAKDVHCNSPGSMTFVAITIWLVALAIVASKMVAFVSLWYNHFIWKVVFHIRHPLTCGPPHDSFNEDIPTFEHVAFSSEFEIYLCAIYMFKLSFPLQGHRSFLFESNKQTLLNFPIYLSTNSQHYKFYIVNIKNRVTAIHVNLQYYFILMSSPFGRSILNVHNLTKDQHLLS